MLEARQKATNASATRSKDEVLNRRWANTRPTKRARFFVHCRGRIAATNANIRPLVPGLRGVGVVPVFLEESSSLCCFVCSSVAKIVFFKSTLSLKHQKPLTYCSASFKENLGGKTGDTPDPGKGLRPLHSCFPLQGSKPQPTW